MKTSKSFDSNAFETTFSEISDNTGFGSDLFSSTEDNSSFGDGGLTSHPEKNTQTNKQRNKLFFIFLV
jgi:hypothetical protein